MKSELPSYIAKFDDVSDGLIGIDTLTAILFQVRIIKLGELYIGDTILSPHFSIPMPLEMEESTTKA